jgi:hypothetical protein
LTSTCGCTRPTVATRFSSGSSARVCVDTGEVSVMPQQIVTSSMCMRERTCASPRPGTARRHRARAQARQVVAREVRLASSAMNIVGTP